MSPPAVTSGEMTPGAGLAGTCGVTSDSDTDGGVAGPPGISLQTVACAAPTGLDETVPVVLPAAIVNDDVEVDDVVVVVVVAGIAVVRGVVMAGDVIIGAVAIVLGVTVGAGTPAISRDDGVVQVTKVPGVAGFDASGTGARVVSAMPETVLAENGPGVLSGCVTMAPGTVGRLIAVLPVVATCA